jgi:hypothetical protein
MNLSYTIKQMIKIERNAAILMALCAVFSFAAAGNPRPDAGESGSPAPVQRLQLEKNECGPGADRLTIRFRNAESALFEKFLNSLSGKKSSSPDRSGSGEEKFQARLMSSAWTAKGS